MGDKSSKQATASDLTNAITDFAVAPLDTDGATEQKETTWMNENWSTYFGYYNQIPELKSAIDAKAGFIMGKGWTADEQTTIILDAIRGWGKESFGTILENCVRVKHLGGDSYCHIILNDAGTLINLKPLSPLTMRHIVGPDGMLIRFEMVTALEDGKLIVTKTFKPQEIFYLSHNRIADQIHGTSIIPSVEKLILARNESMEDWQKVLHWNVRPRWKIMLDSDVQSEIDAFKAKYDAANAKGENFYIPMGTVEVEVLGVAPNATLNPLAWIEMVTTYFYQAVGLPDIIIGGGTLSITDAASKIKYLAFEQTIQRGQLELETEVLNQLRLQIKLEMPAKLENDMMSGKQNEEAMGVNAPEEEPIQGAEPNDTTAEVEGNK